MLQHIIFDVNETLLDLSALDPFFAELFGDSQRRVEWFLTLEECWMTATIIGRYQPFGELAQGALKMVGLRHGVAVSDSQCETLADQLQALPPHPDVLEALAALREKDFILTALTNSSLEAAKVQLETAGLTALFDQVMATSEIECFKPAPETYGMVAERLGIETGQMMMVAAHAWDIAGAASAGCRTAFVERPGKVLNPVGIQPDLSGQDLHAVAQQIIDWQGGPAVRSAF